MFEILLGDLSQVKLLDILRPLLMGKKTGKLSFKSKENGEMYLEAGNMIRPIRYLSEVADKISMGEWDTPIQIKEKGEVGALAESIERMQTGVKVAIEQLQKRNEGR